MNSGPLRVIIGIVILAIIVYVIIFLMQRSTVKRVEEQKEKKQKLVALDTKESLVEGKKLSLTGKSLKQFDDLQSEYQRIEVTDFKAFDQKAADVLFEAKGWNVVRSKQSLNELIALLDGIAEHIVTVRQGIETLQKVDEEHRQAVKQLEGEYQGLRKILLTKNFEFGEAIDKLEELLAALEDDFDEFTHLTEQGDHTAASDIYTQLHSETERLENIIERIPALEQQVSDDFPAQIKELQAAYDQLTKDGYLFPNQRLQADIVAVETSRIITSNLIKELSVDDAQANAENISIKIDGLYMQLQTEIDAKKSVKNKVHPIETFINHARNQNHLLMIELDRIGQRFILNDKQEVRVQKFAEEIKQIENDYRQVGLDIQFNKAVFSDIEKQFITFEDNLTNIEKQQQKIWEDLQDLTPQENKVQAELEKVAFSLRDIKREVEHWNLPGLPVEYKNHYQGLNNQIDRLDRTLQGSHINMYEVKQQIDNIHQDLDSLGQATSNLYIDARLAEQLFQYANRYRLKNQEVSQAYEQALDAYQNHFDFMTAQHQLGQALDSVEPGVYEKMKQQIQ